jgi:hypothetical protein
MINKKFWKQKFKKYWKNFYLIWYDLIYMLVVINDWHPEQRKKNPNEFHLFGVFKRMEVEKKRTSYFLCLLGFRLVLFNYQQENQQEK